MAGTIAIVQARIGSTRLPGKCAKLIEGKPLVWHVLSRVKQSALIDLVVLAIPEETNNGALFKAAREVGVPVCEVSGDSNDLLRRYTVASRYAHADCIVRVPADNPCVDPIEIDRIISFYRENNHGEFWLYSNLDQNIAGNGYPGGLGAEVYHPKLLRYLHETVTDPRLREHPHMWAFERQLVRTLPCPNSFRRPEMRFDVNTEEDLSFIRKVFEYLRPLGRNFRARDVVAAADLLQAGMRSLKIEYKNL